MKNEPGYVIELSQRARLSYFNIIIWYEEQLAGLGNGFSEEIDIVMNLILNAPFQHSVRKNDFRHFNLTKFPYQVIYKIMPHKKIIFVSAICHVRTNPKRKYKRRGKL